MGQFQVLQYDPVIAFIIVLDRKMDMMDMKKILIYQIDLLFIIQMLTTGVPPYSWRFHPGILWIPESVDMREHCSPLSEGEGSRAFVASRLESYLSPVEAVHFSP